MICASCLFGVNFPDKGPKVYYEILNETFKKDPEFLKTYFDHIKYLKKHKKDELDIYYDCADGVIAEFTWGKCDIIFLDENGKRLILDQIFIGKGGKTYPYLNDLVSLLVLVKELEKGKMENCQNIFKYFKSIPGKYFDVATPILKRYPKYQLIDSDTCYKIIKRPGEKKKKEKNVR